MKIKRARFRNFRSLHDVRVDFEDHTVFIGPGNAGKSTILRALNWFFNSETGTLADTDRFTEADPPDPIEVSVTFRDLTEAEMTSCLS